MKLSILLILLFQFSFVYANDPDLTDLLGAISPEDFYRVKPGSPDQLRFYLSVRDLAMTGFLINRELIGLEQSASGERFIYLFAGRSLAYVHAFRSLFYPDGNFSVPFTKGNATSQEEIDKASSPAVLEIFEHFDRFLPNPNQLRGRSIAVSDLAVTGYSSASFYALVRKYYELRYGLSVNITYNPAVMGGLSKAHRFRIHVWSPVHFPGQFARKHPDSIPEYYDSGHGFDLGGRTSLEQYKDNVMKETSPS